MLSHTAADLTGKLLPVQGVDSDALEAIIRSFYTGNCPVSASSVCAVFDAASKLEVAAVEGACKQMVQSALGAGDCVTVLEQALKQGVEPLMQLCTDAITTRWVGVWGGLWLMLIIRSALQWEAYILLHKIHNIIIFSNLKFDHHHSNNKNNKNNKNMGAERNAPELVQMTKRSPR